MEKGSLRIANMLAQGLSYADMMAMQNGYLFVVTTRDKKTKETLLEKFNDRRRHTEWDWTARRRFLVFDEAGEDDISQPHFYVFSNPFWVMWAAEQKTALGQLSNAPFLGKLSRKDAARKMVEHVCGEKELSIAELPKAYPYNKISPNTARQAVFMMG